MEELRAHSHTRHLASEAPHLFTHGEIGLQCTACPSRNHTHPRKPWLELWLSTPRWRQQQQQQQFLEIQPPLPGLWRAAGLATRTEAAVFAKLELPAGVLTVALGFLQTLTSASQALVRMEPPAWMPSSLSHAYAFPATEGTCVRSVRPSRLQLMLLTAAPRLLPHPSLLTTGSRPWLGPPLSIQIATSGAVSAKSTPLTPTPSLAVPHENLPLGRWLI